VNTDAAGTTDEVNTDAAGATDARDGASAPTLRFCAYQCTTDDDCLVNESDVGFRCHPLRKRCERPEDVCQTAADCVVYASFWTDACTSDAECGTRACIDAGGYGRCASKPNKTLGCLFPGTSPMTLPRFGEAGTVEICASAAGRCRDGRCFLGCTGDQDCGKGHGDTCNTQSGICECASSSECGLSTCNTTTHHCECVSNFSCTVPGRDLCVEGKCGCSSTSVCTSDFAGATPVCE
jgi:hypothetical protein